MDDNYEKTLSEKIRYWWFCFLLWLRFPGWIGYHVRSYRQDGCFHFRNYEMDIGNDRYELRCKKCNKMLQMMELGKYAGFRIIVTGKTIKF